MSTEIHLIPDRSFFIQLVLFMSVLFGLSYLLFRPIKKILIARKSRTVELLNEVRAAEERIKIKTQEYAAQIQKTKDEASKEKEAIRQMGIKEESQIKEVARREASKAIDSARAEIARSTDVAINELKGKIPKLSEEIINKFKN